METKNEKAKVVNSLVCLLKALKGWRTTVELRNEHTVRGRITHVDCHMNTRMERCVFTRLNGSQEHFENFFVLGKNIRFVQIPDGVDMLSAICGQIKKYNTESGSGKQKKITDHTKRKLLKRLSRSQQQADGQAGGEAKKQVVEQVHQQADNTADKQVDEKADERPVTALVSKSLDKLTLTQDSVTHDTINMPIQSTNEPV